MTGGLVQVISYGNQDIMLTANPEITFFNIIYRRYTNFGKKLTQLAFDNNVEFGETSVLTIPKNSGDLLSRLTLRIKLPKIDLSNLNKEILSKNILSNAKDNTTYILYYDYFIRFYNNLLNVTNLFFKKYDNIKSLTYIADLSTYILSNINTDKYEQFFEVVNYFYNNGLVTNLNNINVSIFTNASLFKNSNDDIVYIYKNWTESEMSYELFKFGIGKNLDILNNLNITLYSKLKNIIFPTSYFRFSWIDKIGIYLFNSIDFYIGSNKINSLSDYYINNYGELFYKNPEVYNKMIGSNQEINLFTFEKEENFLYLPIPLWFNGNYGLSFPLIALQFNSIQVKINLKKFYECIKIDIDSSIQSEKIENELLNYIIENSIEIIKGRLEISILAEYIYLDSIERRKFAQSGHEYLITQVQEIEFNNLNKYNNSFSLDFFHCCKDMYWFAVKNKNIRDIFNNNGFTYSLSNKIVLKNNNDNLFIEYLKILYDNQKLFNPNDFIVGKSLINTNLLTKDYFQYIGDNIIKVYNYFIDNYHIIKESYLYLNSTVLIGDNSNLFNYLMSYKCYNSSPQKGLYTYSFALNPTETQPSGTINLSRIPSFIIKIKINDIFNNEALNVNKLNYNIINDIEGSKLINNTDINYKLVIQVTNFNVLRLIGGIGALAYTY